MPQRKTIDVFISESKALYPAQFDYRDCLYMNAKTKVRLYCLQHTDSGKTVEEPIDINPDHHLKPIKGSGCKRCKKEAHSQRWSFSLEDVMKVSKSLYGDKYNFSHATYINSHAGIKGICRLHNLSFETTYNQIKQGSCAGCDECKSIQLKLRGERISAANLTSFKDFLKLAKFKHGNSYRYDKKSYSGLANTISYVCVNCQKPKTTRASRHIQGAGCIDCNPPLYYVPFDEEKTLSGITKIQQDHYHIALYKRTSKRAESLFSLQCKKHMPKPEVMSYSRAARIQRCLICEPKISSSANANLRKLRNRHLGLTFTEHSISNDNESVSFLCKMHGEQTLPLQITLQNGCEQCAREENKQYFYSNLPSVISTRTDYSKVNITEVQVKTQKLSLRCKTHNKPYSQYLNMHLQGKQGCTVCKGIVISKVKKEKAMLNQKESVCTFLSKSEVIHGKGHYGYPNLEEEYLLKTSNITIHCNAHDKDLPRFSAAEHISSRPGRGRGCSLCKAEEARKKYRRPWTKVVEACEELGLEVISGKDTYKNGHSKIVVKCQNNHINPKQVGKIVVSRQGCPECSGNIGEEITRALLTQHFGFPLKKIRFPYLHYAFLELDGCNLDKAIAFEYQGAPHVIREFHKNAESWDSQQLRDKHTREMCKHKKITLIEIELFNRYFFDEKDILHSLRKGFKAAGVTLEESRLPNINEVIKTVTIGTNKLDKIEQIATDQNLTLTSEPVWIGKDKPHKWMCNQCNYKFSNSVYQREIAKHKCCPRCARQIGMQKSKLTRGRLEINYFTKLKDTTMKIGIKLTSPKWMGSGYQDRYNGDCLFCHQSVNPFNTNQLANKKIFCRCSGWLQHNDR